MNILPLILLVVVFYFLLIRPQRKRQQEALQMQNSLAPGARVMTTTGLFATVVAIDNEDVILEVSPGVETRWVKAAIGRVVTPVDDKIAATAVPETNDEADETVDRNGDQGTNTNKS
ncbi:MULTISPECIES: preprotein translocase subunit YajC [Nonomuraea]|jgi:preprotein translocase subunit YajC|uniref:Preprotein translocase subunit YajC n=3 Tax=Nonomuraea TaxID=83681 RepID=A0A7W5VAK3_9ACTN|nr:preprotein translocase subunit YajC [Nonomuraea dietziae]MBB3733696.1 preprotein translocase subunit YajC [Nonomuraea dietziae]